MLAHTSGLVIIEDMINHDRRVQTATQVELRIFTQLLRGEQPLTVKEILDRTELKDGTVYPVLGRLATCEVIIYDQDTKPAEVSIAPSFDAWRYILNELSHVQVFSGPLDMLNPYNTSE